MAINKQAVIDVAVAEIGYLEKASNSNLDSKTGNAGSGNWTKYARDLDKISGFYNGPKNGYPWCDVFVDWCMVQAYGVTAAKKLLNHGTSGAGCVYSAQYFRNKGRFYSSPAAGDQIFFGDRGDEYHTGIVEKVTGGRVYTIEGNTSGASGVVDNGGGVFRKSYPVGASYITGYGRPDYDDAEAGTDVKPETNNGEVCNVELRMLSKGDTGEYVSALQILLIGRGFSCGEWGADGDFGSDTDAAVRAFQKAKKIDVDGIVGPDTWTKLLK